MYSRNSANHVIQIDKREAAPEIHIPVLCQFLQARERCAGPQCSTGTAGSSEAYSLICWRSIGWCLLCARHCAIYLYTLFHPLLTLSGGSERLNNFFKFRNPDSGRTGFWTRVCLIPKLMYFQCTMMPYMETNQKSLTSYPGARDSWGGCYLHCSVPGWRRLRWDKGLFQDLWSSHVQHCLHLWPWKGERGLPAEDTSLPSKGEVWRDHPSFPWTHPQEYEQRSQGWWDIHLRKKVVDLTDHGQWLWGCWELTEMALSLCILFILNLCCSLHLHD